jgi:hypothetical protein
MSGGAEEVEEADLRESLHPGEAGGDGLGAPGVQVEPGDEGPELGGGDPLPQPDHHLRALEEGEGPVNDPGEGPPPTVLVDIEGPVKELQDPCV